MRPLLLRPAAAGLGLALMLLILTGMPARADQDGAMTAEPAPEGIHDRWWESAQPLDPVLFPRQLRRGQVYRLARPLPVSREFSVVIGGGGEGGGVEFLRGQERLPAGSLIRLDTVIQAPGPVAFGLSIHTPAGEAKGGLTARSRDIVRAIN